MLRYASVALALMALSCATATGPSSGSNSVLSGNWETIAELLHPVRAPAVATDGQRIYVFGGSAGASPRTAYTQVFDPVTGAWTLAAAAPEPHEWGMAVFADGVVHVLGGVRDGTAATDAHWIYDPDADAWSTDVAIPTPAAGSAAALLDGRIILAGGIDAPSAHSDNVHLFDLASNSWAQGTPTPVERINWQAAVIDGLFYVAGGLSPGQVTSSALLRYDLTQNQWSSLPAMPTQNEGYAAAVVSGLYCVLGGRVAPPSGSFSPPKDDFICYDPDAQQWRIGPRLPSAAEEMGAAAIDGVLYAIGGRVSFGGVTGAVYRIGN